MLLDWAGLELTGPGTRLAAALVRFRSGVILFKRNVVDAAQTRALLDEVTGLGAPHAVRCVDVDGGTVIRLRDALSPMPSAQAVGLAVEKKKKDGLGARARRADCARAVKAFGFNTTLAPVVDLALPESTEVLGSRPPGANAQAVIEYARAYLAGLDAQGVIGCGKHFSWAWRGFWAIPTL